MNPRLRAAAVLGVAAWAACRSPVLDPGLPGADGVPLARDDVRVQAWLERARADPPEPAALRAAARLSIDAPELALSRPQRVVVERPASLRIEVLALFDQVAGVVATNGVEYGFVDLTSGVRDAGPVDDGLLWRTARIDLSPADAVALLLGTPALGATAQVVAGRGQGKAAATPLLLAPRLS